MIFGLPEQNMNILVKDLENILKLDVSHISYYGLSINENTEFYNLYKLGKLKLPEENIEREMYHTIIKTLEKNNFLQYEISNFSKSGFNSKHNLKYWNCKEYLGLGLGSSSYIGGYRFSNTKNLNKYIDYHLWNRVQKDRVLFDACFCLPGQRGGKMALSQSGVLERE